MSVPTPRALDRRHPYYSASSASPVTTAAALAAYRTEMLQAGLPASIADELVTAAGRTLVHTAGLTTTTTTPAGTPTTTTIGGPAAQCRCTRPRSTEGR